MNKKIRYILLLLLISLLILLIFYFKRNIDGFSNYNLNKANSDVKDTVLLEDTYPTIKKNIISNNNANNIWWHYPIFKLGSYAQITNNIKFVNNPDIGSCTPASMCGALYDKKNIKSNYIKPLPVLNPTNKTRIGYFDTNIKLTDSLPYRTNMQNILY